MNAAFLLVTTAWFAGDTTAVPVTAAGDCGACSRPRDPRLHGHKLFGKLQGLFKRKEACGGCDSCSAPKCHAPVATCCEPRGPARPCKTRDTWSPSLVPSCSISCGLASITNGRVAVTAAAARCRDSGGVRRRCAYGGTTVMPKAGETIPTPPKKMPSTPPTKGKQIGIETAPIGSTNSPILEVAPNASQVPPAIVPSVESDNRSPF